MLSFAVFKAGIFIMGAELGTAIAVYIIHATALRWLFHMYRSGMGLGMLALTEK